MADCMLFRGGNLAVLCEHFLDRPQHPDLSLFEPERLRAPSAAQVEIVRSKDQDAGALDESLDSQLGLGHEMRVAGQEPFVPQQDFRLKAGGNGKTEPQHHAPRVGPYRHHQIVAKLGKFGDFRYAALHGTRANYEQLRAGANVVETAELRIDAEVDVEHRRYPPARHHRAMD